jgi:hypothetical protein
MGAGKGKFLKPASAQRRQSPSASSTPSIGRVELANHDESRRVSYGLRMPTIADVRCHTTKVGRRSAKQGLPASPRRARKMRGRCLIRGEHRGVDPPSCSWWPATSPITSSGLWSSTFGRRQACRGFLSFYFRLALDCVAFRAEGHLARGLPTPRPSETVAPHQLGRVAAAGALALLVAAIIQLVTRP